MMNRMLDVIARVLTLLDKTRTLDFSVLLLMRLLLAPVFISAGMHKLANFSDIASWFGNAEWGLGLPFPVLMAALATAAELVGGLFLLAGFMTRLVAIPLMITMLVAALSVHWQHGWFAIAPSNPATSAAQPLALMGIPAAQRSLENSAEVGERLQRARSLLREHGNYDWLIERGGLVVLNNGIEFSAIYFIMLLALFFYGAGRYVSADYWLARAMPGHRPDGPGQGR